MGNTAAAHTFLPGIGIFTEETALDRQPTNTNNLLQTSFKFDVKRIPAVSFFCQAVNIPSVTLGEIEQPTRFSIPIKRSGSTFVYDDIEVQFIMDEEMKAWLEIHNWMSSLTNTTGFQDYVDAGHGTPPRDEDNHYSDAVLVVTNSAKNPIIEIIFRGCFPKTLSSIEFDSTTTETAPIIATATFAFTSYEVKTL